MGGEIREGRRETNNEEMIKRKRITAHVFAVLLLI